MLLSVFLVGGLVASFSALRRESSTFADASSSRNFNSISLICVTPLGRASGSALGRQGPSDTAACQQFHSNIIGQSVTVYREEARDKINHLMQYILAHGVADPLLRSIRRRRVGWRPLKRSAVAVEM